MNEAIEMSHVPVAALEDRDIDWVDVTAWATFQGHALPVAVARRIAQRVNAYHAYRVELSALAVREPSP